MIRSIINKNGVKKNRELKQIQKKTKKYYGDKLFAKNHREPKAKIQKLVDVTNISFVSLVKEAKSREEIPENVTREQLIQLCEKQNLTGGSGNGYPIAEKLKACPEQNGILLINGVECDPGLAQDAWIYRNRLEQVAQGIAMLNQIYHFKRVVLATKEPLSQKKYDFDQIKVKNRFPMGYENYLIRSIWGFELAEGEHPIDRGILVLNIQSVLLLVELFLYKDRQPARYLTVSDAVSGKAVVVKAPFGMDAKEIYERAMRSKGGTLDQVDDSGTTETVDTELYIGGGAFMCQLLEKGEKSTECTSYIASGKMPAYENAGKCAGCGRCVSNCPAGVMVAKIVQYVDQNGMVEPEKCKIFHPERCIGCGACTYGCRAGKDTRQLVMWAQNN